MEHFKKYWLGYTLLAIAVIYVALNWKKLFGGTCTTCGGSNTNPSPAAPAAPSRTVETTSTTVSINPSLVDKIPSNIATKIINQQSLTQSDVSILKSKGLDVVWHPQNNPLGKIKCPDGEEVTLGHFIVFLCSGHGKSK